MKESQECEVTNYKTIRVSNFLRRIVKWCIVGKNTDSRVTNRKCAFPLRTSMEPCRQIITVLNSEIIVLPKYALKTNYSENSNKLMK